jgi:SMI1 / KNR4 family (SUKH-1)/WD domain, G-beta repeat
MPRVSDPRSKRASGSGVAERIRKLVTEIVELRDSVGASEMELGVPATQAQIASAERRAKMKFPRSYRTYLAMHNGWLGFWPDWSLLGVSGRITDEMRRDVNQSLQLAKHAIDNDAEMNDLEPSKAWAALERDERRSPNVIHPLRHPVLGTDFNGGLLLFDRNRLRGGEPQVVAIHNGLLEQRWSSFEQLLAAARDDLRRAGSKSRPAPRKRPRAHRAAVRERVTSTPISQTLVSDARDTGAQAAKRLVSASADGTLMVWDPIKARVAKTLKGHTRAKHGVLGVRGAPDGRRVASWGDDRTIRLWDPNSGKAIATLVEAERWVRGVAFHPREPLLAAIVDDRITVFDLRNAATVLDIPESSSAAGVRPRAALQFSPTGAEIVCVAGSTIVEVFDAASGKRLREWSVAPARELVYDAGNLKWSPRGQLFGFTYKNYVCLCTIKDGKSIRRIDVQNAVYSFAWMRTGEDLAVATTAGIACWTVDGKQKWSQPLKKSDGTPAAITCGPDGTIAEGGSAKVIRLRNADSGEQVASLKGHSRAVTDLDYVLV